MERTEMATGRLTHPLIGPEHLAADVALYSRQSSEKQVEQNTGSAEYQRSLAEIPLRYGWRPEQIITIEDDLGRSGTTVENRPGFKKMEELIVSGKVKVVITANTSRLSRNLLDLIQLFALAARHGVLLIIDQKIINPRDEHDIFLSQILGSVAEYENKLRTETMSRARWAKARLGEIVSALPVGFTVGCDETIIKDPATAPYIDLVIATFREQGSLLRTVRALRQKDIKLPSTYRKGGIVWEEPTVDKIRSIILGPAYAGIYVFGKSETRPDIGRCRNGLPKRRPRPEERWIKITDRLPTYTSHAEQEDFKKLLKKNSFSQRHRPGHGSALCQGILVCSRCGAKLTVSYVT
jgi:DNA invertase Pin-like site-specific DNA recombinase